MADSQTKYNLGCKFVGRKKLEEFDDFFKTLKKRIGTQIHEVFAHEKHKPPKERRLITFVSGKLGQYKSAFNRHFYRIARLVHGIPIACR
ncbi:MAG: hypothetical protein QMC89_03085 [Candidatus Hodarchaeaceae archaeon]|nr:hypothetical protein [Candidatus Hodarchaeaceae archaeon]